MTVGDAASDTWALGGETRWGREVRRKRLVERSYRWGGGLRTEFCSGDWHEVTSQRMDAMELGGRVSAHL